MTGCRDYISLSRRSRFAHSVVLDATLAQEISRLFDPATYLSLALLFGIAAQFGSMGGYATMRMIIAKVEGRVGILGAVVTVTAVFSPLILNDVVVLILTPVIAAYSKERNADVAPLLVAEVTFVNLASSLTPFGNPQNILLWQTTGISAAAFVAGTSLPLALSAIVTLPLLYVLGRRSGREKRDPVEPASVLPAAYLALVASAVFLSSVLGMSGVVGLGVAFALGFVFNLRSLSGLSAFDLKSLLVLYVFVASSTLGSVFLGPTLGGFAAAAASGTQPFSALFVGALSNVVSNVPATQLVLSLAQVPPDVAPKIAVEAGLAGNIDPIASFANILAILLVRRAGLPVKRAIALQAAIALVSFLPALL